MKMKLNNINRFTFRTCQFLKLTHTHTVRHRLNLKSDIPFIGCSYAAEFGVCWLSLSISWKMFYRSQTVHTQPMSLSYSELDLLTVWSIYYYSVCCFWTGVLNPPHHTRLLIFCTIDFVCWQPLNRLNTFWWIWIYVAHYRRSLISRALSISSEDGKWLLSILSMSRIQR